MRNNFTWFAMVVFLLFFPLCTSAVPAGDPMDAFSGSGDPTPLDEPFIKLKAGYDFVLESSSPNRWLGLYSMGAEICIKRVMLGVEAEFGNRTFNGFSLEESNFMLSLGYLSKRSTHLIISTGFSWSKGSLSQGDDETSADDFYAQNSIPLVFSLRKCICLQDRWFLSLSAGYRYNIVLDEAICPFNNSTFILKAEIHYSLISR